MHDDDTAPASPDEFDDLLRKLEEDARTNPVAPLPDDEIERLLSQIGNLDAHSALPSKTVKTLPRRSRARDERNVAILVGCRAAAATEVESPSVVSSVTTDSSSSVSESPAVIDRRSPPSWRQTTDFAKVNAYIRSIPQN